MGKNMKDESAKKLLELLNLMQEVSEEHDLGKNNDLNELKEKIENMATRKRHAINAKFKGEFCKQRNYPILKMTLDDESIVIPCMALDEIIESLIECNKSYKQARDSN